MRTAIASRHDVDLAIKALDLQEENQKIALRKYYEREREMDLRRISARWRITRFALTVLLISLVFWAFGWLRAL